MGGGQAPARGRPEDRRWIRVGWRPGLEAVFAFPEDVIVKKMAFYKEGSSEKHRRDITEWAERLDLADLWTEILERIAE